MLALFVVYLMDRISFVTFTDIHISDNSPQNRKGNYKKDILDKLRQIGMVGKKLGVDFYLCGGDLYDHKAPMRNSHSLNTELIRIFNSYGAPIYATEGNHDLRNDSYVDFESQPISVLYEGKAMIQLRNELVEKGSLKVGLRAFPFQENPDMDNMPRASKDVDCSVCIKHIYSTPEGGTLFKHKLYSYDEIGILGDDIFLMGHYHVDQGIRVISTHGLDQHFINVGALSRGALSEDNIKRSPKICYVTITKDNGIVEIKTQQVKLKVKSVEDIFDLQKKEEEKKKIQDAEDFVNKLKDSISEEESEGDSIENEIANLNIDKKIINKVKHFISEASLKVQDVIE